LDVQDELGLNRELADFRMNHRDRRCRRCVISDQPLRAIQNGWNILGLKLPRRTTAIPLISGSIRNGIAANPRATFAFSERARKRAAFI
jgi:hypothetical protein